MAKRTYSKNLLRRDRHSLATAFPKAFEAPSSGNPKRPLKIGIHQDIAERGGVPGPSTLPISQWRLYAAITDYTAGRRYQQAIADGGMRIDLDGNQIEPVTDDQIQEAKRRLAEMDAAVAEKAEAASMEKP